MCGIYGFSRLNEKVRRMAPILGWCMASRGRDAWGMTDGNEVERYGGSITSGWHEPPEHWTSAIFHTRGASIRDGCELPENAHPFTSVKKDGSTVIGIHNGIIRDNVELNTKHNRTFHVDSAHLWAHRAEEMKWDDLSGWANVVWWETINSQREMRLARINDTDLHIATLSDGTMAFCSLANPLDEVAKMMGNPVRNWWKVDEGTVYRLSRDYEIDNGKFFGDVPLPSGEKVRFSSKFGIAQSSYLVYIPGQPINSNLPARREQSYCRNCFLVPIAEDCFLCGECLGHMLDGWLTYEIENMDEPPARDEVAVVPDAEGVVTMERP